jgi:glycerol uptake facilitator protein
MPFQDTFFMKVVAEFLGTAILVILGNGAVANVHLKGSKGFASGWIVIASGYGIGVMVPVMMFHQLSSQINPAVTIALAAWGHQSWSVVPAFVTAQMLGAMVGQLAIVVTHKPYYDQTKRLDDVLGTFATTNAAGSRGNGFATEFLGTLVLALAALVILDGPSFAGAPGAAAIGVGFLVWGLVAGLGGPSGPALNPARDLGPRIVHALYPLRYKGSSQWWYSWVPVTAPILGALGGVGIFTWFLG